MLLKLLENTRRAAFWGMDFISGQPVKKAYQDIKVMDALDSLHPVLLQYQRDAFARLVQHATQTTQFYKKYSGKDLAYFPVINKEQIRESQSEFFSESFQKDDLVQMSTSGSTGTPFVCYQDKAKKRRVHAEVIYYSQKAGYNVGTNLIFLRALTEKNKKSVWHQWMENQSLLDISKLDDASIHVLLKNIERISRRGSMILGYGSTFDALKDYFDRNGYADADLSEISGIVSSSEMLFDDTRSSMEMAFNCKVVSRYSNQENGIIGQDELLNNVFFLNEANYIVEIFDMHEDELQDDGNVGRIVITDLYNYGMPMIRYDTGDVGAITYHDVKGKRKRAISSFGGRKVDVIFNCYGNRLSPHSITNALWSFPEIGQFQLIQEERRRYTLNVKGNKFNRINELRMVLLDVLGESAKIEIKFVEEIPTLCSGKRKYIINRQTEV